ncbi:MAG: DUF4280 domain-containing protein [Polaribacter sp.]
MAKNYVCDGAKIECKLCTKPKGTLKVTSNEIKIQDKLFANAKDKEKVNLIFKGNCTKSPNSSSPCQGVMVVGEWQGTADALIQDDQALLEDSIIMCTYGGVPIKITDDLQVSELTELLPTDAAGISPVMPMKMLITSSFTVAGIIQSQTVQTQNEVKENEKQAEKITSPYLFYSKEGIYLCGPTDDVQLVYITNDNVNIGDKKMQKDWDEIKNNATRLNNDIEANGLSYKDFKHFSATVLGESSVGFAVIIKEEIYAFASANDNFKKWYKKKKKEDISYRSVINKTGAYAISSDQYKLYYKKTEEERNGNISMKYANAAVINAITGGIDHSNGAVKWSGIDMVSTTEKWREGYQFTSMDHDIFFLGDYLKSGKTWWKDKSGKKTKVRGEWDYKWKSTAAFSGKNPNLTNPSWDDYKDHTKDPARARMNYYDKTKTDSIDTVKKKVFFESNTKYIYGTVFCIQTDEYIKAQGGEFY